MYWEIQFFFANVQCKQLIKSFFPQILSAVYYLVNLWSPPFHLTNARSLLLGIKNLRE
jgi:hypothetical protein